MATTKPKFVRLPERLTSGNITDLESGWHIGGFDVKQVPDQEENPAAHNFVVDKWRQGHLESAGAQEHQVVQDAKKEMLDTHLGHLDLGDALERYGHQEQPLQDMGAKHRRQLAKLRETDPQEQETAYEEQRSGYTQSIGGAGGTVDADVTPSGATKERKSNKTEDTGGKDSA